MGKCGSREGLDFISGLNFNENEKSLLKGQAWGLTRFAINNLTSDASTEKAIEILTIPNVPDEIKHIISYYFSRGRNLNLNGNAKHLIIAFNEDGYLYTKMNIAFAPAQYLNLYGLFKVF